MSFFSEHLLNLFIGVLGSLIAAVIVGWVKTANKPRNKERTFNAPETNTANSVKPKRKSINKTTPNKNRNIYFYTVVYDVLLILFSIINSYVFWIARKKEDYSSLALLFLIFYFLYNSIVSFNYLIKMRSVPYTQIFNRFGNIQMTLGITAFFTIFIAAYFIWTEEGFPFMVVFVIYAVLLPFFGIMGTGSEPIK